jgi:hypothetical protein
MMYVKFGTGIAWTWYVLIGTAVTFGVAVLAHLASRRVASKLSERAE